MKKTSSSETVFCCNCSSELRSNSQYCWKCQADQSEVGPPAQSRSITESPTTSSAPDVDKKLSFGRPILESIPKPLSLEEYMKSKSKQQTSGHTFRQGKKRKVSDNKNETVTINIGLMKIVSDDLKPIWGKRLPLVVAKNSNYHTILEKAVEKYTAFDRKFDTGQEHVLVYEDGSHAQLMPGGKNFFQLDNYKAEVGKDFKRITLYLCTADDLNMSESSISPSGSPSQPESRSPPTALLNEEPCMPEDTISDDEKLAQNLQRQYDSEIMSIPTVLADSADETTSTQAVLARVTKPEDVVKILQQKVTSDADNFFMVVRREIPLPRLLSLWQRQVKKTPATRILRVRIIGEAGIDSGAIAKEFLETSIKNIGENMFPDGVPVDSTLHVQNGNYHTCSEIVAVSLAQGGPPPCFLDSASFDMMVKDADIRNIDESNLAEKEQMLLKEVKSSLKDKTDFILEHGYTGPIDQEHIKDIIGSVKVSLINRRTLYMKEFLAGMKIYGLDELIKSNPDICRPLFVNGAFRDSLVPDANFVLSILNPTYSEEGSSRRKIEESVVDFFQDTLLSFEDSRVCGYASAVAWNYSDEVEGERQKTSLSHELPEEKYVSPDLSISGVMQWLTGQRHKPMGNELFEIKVLFDHECMQRNPLHSICFPRVGACGKEITFPTAHLQTESEFHRVFLLAYCKGQAFAKP